jgi:hypothetical protein
MNELGQKTSLSMKALVSQEEEGNMMNAGSGRNRSPIAGSYDDSTAKGIDAACDDDVASDASTILHNNLTTSSTEKSSKNESTVKNYDSDALPLLAKQNDNELLAAAITFADPASASPVPVDHSLSDVPGSTTPHIHPASPKLTVESIQNHLLQQRSTTVEGMSDFQPIDRTMVAPRGRDTASGVDRQAASSDILSTASEMGTVIETEHSLRERLAQLEDDDVDDDYFSETERLDDEQSRVDLQSANKALHDDSTTVVTPKRRNNNNSIYEHMFEEVDDYNDEARPGVNDEVGLLALPALDGTFHVDEKKVAEGGSPVNSAVFDNDRNQNRFNRKSEGAVRASSILSRTMKRFSSQLLPASTSSYSAPNTPLGLTRGVSCSSLAEKDPRHPPAAPATLPPESSAFVAAITPTSFLLRSPGSSARMAARSRYHKQQQQPWNDPSRGRETGGTLGNDSLLLPRFSQWTPRRQAYDADEVPGGCGNNGVHEPSSTPFSPRKKYGQALARACFSFDAYDTCVDHLYEVPAVLLDPVLERPSRALSTTSSLVATVGGDSDAARHSASVANHLHYPTIHEQSPEISKAASSSSLGGPILSPLRDSARTCTQPLFRTSSSWDVGSSPSSSSCILPRETRRTSPTRPLREPVAFRPTLSSLPRPQIHHSSSRSYQQPLWSDRSNAIHRRRTIHQPFQKHKATELNDGGLVSSPPRLKTSSTASSSPQVASFQSRLWSSPQRGMPGVSRAPPQSSSSSSSTAARIAASSYGPADVLASPQRLEMEREDALDILACLVERGITLKSNVEEINGVQKTTENAGKRADHGTVAEAGSKALDPVEVTRARNNISFSSDRQGKEMDLTVAVKALVQISSLHQHGNHSDTNDDLKQGTSRLTHDERVEALEELLRSHEYALEMRRVSQSASSWLKSIGRTTRGSDTTNTMRAAAQASSDADSPSASMESTDAGVDLLTAKAMLHSARLEIEEKSKLAQTLNSELAKCRAEIGRLKSAANTSINSSFRSPNRSILDMSEEISPTSSVERGFDNASPIPEKDDSQCLNSSFEDIIPLQEDRNDLAKFQAALEDANEMIRKLHSDLMLLSQGNMREGAIQDEAPVVDVPDVVTVSPNTSKDEAAMSVRMLDVENYMTDWDELRPSLPPPPDHELRSPVVAAVLDQWSSDQALHDRLIEWIEQVLAGADPSSIPPLTISNLNHQVRDGFITHILPLLLRRRDIRVDVQTRTQRLTTYDLAVAVEGVAFTAPPAQVIAPVRSVSAIDSRLHNMVPPWPGSEFGNDSTTHSTVTAMMSNKHNRHLDPYPLRSTSSSRSAPVFLPDDSNYGRRETITSQLSYDEMTDGSVGPRNPQSGIMSALGGALGGLLSRRKAGGGGATGTPANASSGGKVMATAVTASSRASMDAMGLSPGNGEDPDKDREDGYFDGDIDQTDQHQYQQLLDHQSLQHQQPYHRVVAAPPGRLGVTFVEYKGHAMVSDVLGPDQSPLAGFVFPGDILVAVDEVPVTGMPVRDVIQVLRDRGNRQRALRVISSHEMAEPEDVSSSTLDHLHRGPSSDTSVLMSDVS